MRAYMNLALARYALEQGTVVDLGGGKDPSYMKYLKGVQEASRTNIDKQHAPGSAGTIDFEKDALPYADSSVDQVLMLNVLEHIYHHGFFVGEAHRILKPGKQVLGFVPFLINYHADPHDYFRYTDEALERIFNDSGFSKTEVLPLGAGPFTANLNNLASFMPALFIAIGWPLYWLLDAIVVALKPSMKRRFPLGYLFVLTK